MPKKKRETDESSVIVSRVQREAMEGKRPKGEKESSIIRSRVIHGDEVVEGAAKAARKSAAKRTRTASTRSRRSRSTATTTPTSTET